MHPPRKVSMKTSSIPNDQTAGAAVSRVFRHEKRPNWGLGALVWERNGKRAYQFEDGQLRVFKRGFYHLLHRVDEPKPQRAMRVRRLARRAQVEKIPRGRKLPTLRDQIQLFLSEFPKGFIGDDWNEKHRGTDAKRRRKSHRDPSASSATTRLAEPALAEAIERGDYREVLDRVIEVLRDTDLVPTREVKALAQLEPTKELANAFYEYLHGKEESPHGFTSLLTALRGAGGPSASWPMMTALRALLDPKRHVCVRPSAFTAQLQMMMPGMEVPKHPTAAGYARFRKLARDVEASLIQQGHQPRDLLDVYDFIWLTLRPASKAKLESVGSPVAKAG